MKEEDNELFGNVLSLILVFGFLVIVGIMLFHEIPETSRDMLGPLIGGVIGASVSTIVQHRWGSSRGSDKKTDIINQLTGTGDGAGKVTTNATITTEKVTTVTPEEPAKEQP